MWLFGRDCAQPWPVIRDLRKCDYSVMTMRNCDCSDVTMRTCGCSAVTAQLWLFRCDCVTLAAHLWLSATVTVCICDCTHRCYPSAPLQGQIVVPQRVGMSLKQCGVKAAELRYNPKTNARQWTWSWASSIHFPCFHLKMHVYVTRPPPSWSSL